jgi:hypothetical protein
MKRLVYPMLLITASLVIGAILTTITASTFASYATENNNSTIVEEQLTDAAGSDNIIISTENNFSVSK